MPDSVRRTVLVVEDDAVFASCCISTSTSPGSRSMRSATADRRSSNVSDGIFADSLASELVTPAGSPSGGYAATFQIGVSV